jgi:hypothetical protein
LPLGFVCIIFTVLARMNPVQKKSFAELVECGVERYVDVAICHTCPEMVPSLRSSTLGVPHPSLYYIP